jgi:hypothetical protein
MKFAPIMLACVAISAVGFALPPEPIANRTERVPLAEPIPVTVDQLALRNRQGHEFDESLIPDDVKKLNGRRVQIIGRMYVIRAADPVATFVLNGYSQQKPDYLNPGIQFFIPVTLPPGATTPMTLDPIEIEGRLVIRPKYRDGKLTSIYEVEDASVEPTERPEGFSIPVLPIFGC